MADKGGADKSAKGGKSALKSQGKSKNGKKVQFDSEDCFEDNPSQSNGKGGKVVKESNATNKPAETAPRLDESELPPNSVCLMDSEAAEIIQGIQDQMVFLSQDPDIKLPVSFDTGFTFAKRNGNYAKPQTVRKIFESLKNYGVTDCEICLISNICPESVDEVFALVPSLEPKMTKLKEPVRIALAELANLKESLANLKKPS